MAEFRMPSLGADMEAGTLVRWRVRAGDVVKRGDIVAVVETQKGAIEIEVFHAGVVERLVVAEGARVPVGTVLATIADAAPASPTAASAPIPAEPPPPAPPVATAPPPAPPRSPPPSAWVRSSPAARARAHELEVDLTTVEGTGPHGAVRRDDVERHAAIHAAPSPVPAAPSPVPAAPSPVPAARPPPDAHTAMRQAIAAAMARSNREIPHYYLAHRVDLHAATAWLAEHNSAREPADRVLVGALLVRATALALRKFPDLNGTWTEGGLRAAPAINPGIAVSLRGGGLVIPALLAADTLDVDATMAGMKDLVARARAGRLRSSELAEGTITITSLGEQGADAVFGVIYPPQVALVGFGRVHDAVVAVDGLIAVRPVVDVTLAADHRASDGHRGALFLHTLDALLQEPEHL